MTQEDPRKEQQKKEYDPEVYRRLALVQKQFEANKAEQLRKEQSEQKRLRRERLTARFRINKTNIGRIVVYCVVGAILLAVIIIAIRGAL